MLNNFTFTIVNGYASQQRVCFAKPSLEISQHLMMQCSPEPRSLTSNSFNLVNGGTVGFEHRQSNFNLSSSETQMLILVE